MKVWKFFATIIITLGMLFTSCKNKVLVDVLSANVFSEKILQTDDAQVVDVRTPEEYSEGHIKGAVNMNWNASDFGESIKSLDKEQPVFVYCLSGGRSASAASFLKEKGFEQIYDLEGGILKWRAANLPEEGLPTASTGMTISAFEQLLTTEKVVLVDFYATWCAPCQKMKPFLEEISNEQSQNVTVVRIDLDQNRIIGDAMKINALPAIRIYKNKELKFSKDGFMSKEALLEALANIK